MSLFWFGNYDLLIFDRIDSTNDEAIRLVKSGVRGDVVIIAREQTKGKGSKGRYWHSISGNLHVSILLEAHDSLLRLQEMPFLVGLAIHDAIKEQAELSGRSSIDIKLKWPNDVLVEGKKIAGILLESVVISGKLFVVVGIGVNTHFIPKIDGVEATSLLNEGIILRHADDFLSIIMTKFHQYYVNWQADKDFNRLRTEWLAKAYNLGNKVSITDGKNTLTGIYKGIDSNGAFCLELEDGKICDFVAGDISFIQN